MEDQFKENFKSALSKAEKSLYSGALVALFVWTISTTKTAEKFTIPILEIEMEGKSGVLIIMLLYMGLGAQLLYSLKVANQNLKKLNAGLQEALLLSPSILSGPILLRLGAVLIPFIIFVGAISDAFKNNIATAFYVSTIYSVFHLWALVQSYHLKT